MTDVLEAVKERGGHRRQANRRGIDRAQNRARLPPCRCPFPKIPTVDLRFLPSCYGKLRKGREVFVWDDREPEGMVTDRRYRYGDPISPPRFWSVEYFVGSIVSPATGQALYGSLVIGLAIASID